MFDFTDKKVLITGACGNLGRATAQAFKQAGARIALLDITEKCLREQAKVLDVLAIPCDLTRFESTQAAIQTAATELGGIDVLANIAGGFRMGPPLHEAPIDDWNFMMDLNARSVFNACRSAIPHMLVSGNGRIINVGARAAVTPKANMAPYCASKAAVVTLTEALALEHKHDLINVNCILPGTVDTPENRAAMPDADFEKWVAPETLADVILFLASDAARGIKGAAIPVYGQS